MRNRNVLLFEDIKRKGDFTQAHHHPNCDSPTTPSPIFDLRTNPMFDISINTPKFATKSPQKPQKNGNLKTTSVPLVFRMSKLLRNRSHQARRKKQFCEERSTAQNSKALTNLLAISLPDIHQNCYLNEDRRKYKSMYSISYAFQPFLVFMRLIGMFPVFPRNNQQQRWITQYLKRTALFALTLFCFLLNIYYLFHNLQILWKFYDKFGVMHASTVSTVVSSAKPLINLLHLAIFCARLQSHLQMLSKFDSVERSFWAAFGRSPNTRKMVVFLFVWIFTSFAIPFIYRVYETVTLNRLQPGTMDDWQTYLSLFVVPQFTLWNTLPLLYFVLCNKLVCFWTKTLEQSICSEQRQRNISLRFFYQHFLRIAELQNSIGNLFNPFVLFSLAWSLIMLSLSIYFVTQPTWKLAEPITQQQVRSEEFRRMLTERIWLNLGWALLQICVACAHMAVICAVGANTNEKTRNIISAILAVQPDPAYIEADRFQISCFMHKISTQYMWGMSVWRAFPIERSTFFTLVSVIITYAFLLLRLKDKTIDTQFRLVTASGLNNNNNSVLAINDTSFFNNTTPMFNNTLKSLFFNNTG